MRVCGTPNLLIKTGKIDEARQYFENAVKNQPDNPYLRHILGEVYLAAGAIEDGEKTFEQAVVMAPRMTSSYLKACRNL